MEHLKKIIYIVLFGLIFMLNSCSEDFLEQKLMNDINEDVLFKTEADAYAIVNGAYDIMHNNTDFQIKSLWYSANYLSQDHRNWGSDVAYITYEVPTNHGSLLSLWTKCYQGISRANSAIDNITVMINNEIITPEKGNRLIGECIFLRGLYHSFLACNFGGVPVYKKVVIGDGLDPKISQDNVFMAVAEDFEMAAELLPWTYPAEDVGRATKGAALAYLGQSLMWLKDYKKAETVFAKVINEGPYSIEGNFYDIHEPWNQNGKECIFAIQCIENENRGGSFPSPGGDDMQWFENFFSPEETSASGMCGYSYVTKEYYDCFDSLDSRKIASVIGPGEIHPSIDLKRYGVKDANGDSLNTCGTLEKPWKGTDNGRSGYYVMKYWRRGDCTRKTDDDQFLSDVNPVLLRLGQVKLEYAECLFRNNKEAEARIVVEEIRKRAYKENYAIAPPFNDNYPTNDFMDDLVQEYRKEVSGEFSFCYILRRAGEHKQFVKEIYNLDIPLGKDLMPIPQAEIDKNPNLKQNPYY